MVKPNVLITVGSPSDLYLLNDLALDDRVEFSVSVASAHRTPATVANHAIWKRWDAVIAGAGMTNALLSDYVTDALPEQLVFGVPIFDKATGGLSSVLSSQELPPGYVAACVSMGKLGRAARLAADLVSTDYKSVVLYNILDIPVDKPMGLLKKLGVPARVEELKLHGNSFTVPDGELPLVLMEDAANVMFLNNPDRRPMIASVRNTNLLQNPIFQDCDYLAVVGYDNPTNLALFGAKVVSRNNAQVAVNIVDYLEEGVKKYDDFKDVISLSPESLDALKAKYGVKK